VQWLGAAYLAWLGFRMLMAGPGAPNIIQIKPHHYFQQALTITVLNPKAIVFYMAFLPLFIDPQAHLGWLTFGVMALTVAVLAFVYCFAVILLTHFLAERLRASPLVSSALKKFAGVCLIGFGLKLAMSR
jgi:threonine/homoserine/homoserine lactone efflux protein